MSILMPALAKVREQAKDVLGQSNLKQWGTIFEMYAGQNDSTLPAGWYDGCSAKDYWYEALRPYYGNQGDLRVCPKATKPTTEVNGSPNNVLGPRYAWGVFPGDVGKPSSWWPVVIAGDYGSYGTNGWASNPPEGLTWGAATKNFWRTMNVKGAGRAPLFCDDQWLAGWPEYENEPAEFEDMPWNQGSGMVRLGPNRHNGHVQQVFMDLSVHRVGLKELWTLKWHRTFITDGPWTLAGGVTKMNWPVWMRKFKDY
jgi:hypothetical protein